MRYALRKRTPHSGSTPYGEGPRKCKYFACVVQCASPNAKARHEKNCISNERVVHAISHDNSIIIQGKQLQVGECLSAIPNYASQHHEVVREGQALWKLKAVHGIIRTAEGDFADYEWERTIGKVNWCQNSTEVFTEFLSQQKLLKAVMEHPVREEDNRGVPTARARV